MRNSEKQCETEKGSVRTKLIISSVLSQFTEITYLEPFCLPSLPHEHMCKDFLKTAESGRNLTKREMLIKESEKKQHCDWNGIF